MAPLPPGSETFLDVFRNPATAWIIIPMLIFSIPILQALISPINNLIKANERERQRKMYERLTLEKLDVVKTAVAMGYQRADLEALDKQLENVIGTEAMQRLLDTKASSSKDKLKGAIQINVQAGSGAKGAKTAGTSVNLEELVSGEIGEPLRSRQREETAD